MKPLTKEEIEKQAWEEYGKIEKQALKEYEKIEKQALKEYEKKCKERESSVDNQVCINCGIKSNEDLGICPDCKRCENCFEHKCQEARV